MKPIVWTELGFTDEEAAELSGLRLNSESFTLGEELAIWAQWVSELETGQLWVAEDLDAAWAAREDVESSITRLLWPEHRNRVLAFLDDLDRRFRDLTVPLPSGARLPPALARREPETPASWWHGRVPLRNAQRLYPFDEGSPLFDDRDWTRRPGAA